MHQCPPLGYATDAAVQWGWTVETRPKPSFQISLTWQASTRRVKGVEIQSLVQYWIKTVCCRSKDHFDWTAPCTPLVPKVGGHCPSRPRLRRPWATVTEDKIKWRQFKFAPISTSSCKIWWKSDDARSLFRIFRFSKCRPSAILDLVWFHCRSPTTCVWWS